MQMSFAKQFLVTTAALALGWLGVMETAGGATIGAKHTGLGLYQAVKINQVSNPLNGRTVAAGIYKWKATGSSGDLGFARTDLLDANGTAGTDEFVAFCIDPNEWLLSRSTFTVNHPLGDTISLTGEVDATEAAWLRRLFSYQSPFEPSLDAKTAAALAVAVWEIVGEVYVGGAKTFSVSAGDLSFSGDSAVTGEAQSILDNFLSATPIMADVLVGLIQEVGAKNYGQDMLAFRIPSREKRVPPSGDFPVPVPGTVFLLGVGLLTIGIHRSRGPH
jgi:hypothetical protein